MDNLRKGTPGTRDFYNEIGWQREGDTLVDTRLFGWANGPVNQALGALRQTRVRQAAGGPGQKIAELGCGGTPAVFLAEGCARYTATDFSFVGLTEAAQVLKRANVPFTTIEADITALPFLCFFPTGSCGACWP